MTPEVSTAIEEIRDAYQGSTVEVHEDGAGGAWVIVEPIDPGPTFVQRETWVGFQITFQYPAADCYPHFVRPDLARVDGQPLGDATSAGTFGFDQRPGIQLSRRSNRLNPATDTAEIKLTKVIEWLRSK